MTKLICYLLFVLAAISCKKEQDAPTVVLNEMTSGATVSTGNFMNGPYGSVMGSAQIIDSINNMYKVQLNNFSSSNGPDLYVYLSKEIMPVNAVELGKLKSVNGSQVYEIPGNTDHTAYKYVCIHCKQYNHLFGYALLK